MCVLEHIQVMFSFSVSLAMSLGYQNLEKHYKDINSAKVLGVREPTSV